MPLANLLWRTVLVSILSCGGALAAAPVPTQPAVRAGSENVAARANNAFALDLYGRLAGDTKHAGKNLFFSPYSISVALTMAAEGARGRTAEEMGRAVFDGAQFGGISAVDDPEFMPYISAVRHTATVEVNEKGTEAAAATSVQWPVFGAASSRRPMKPFIPTFRADRPFIFAIQDTRTGVILFIGRVCNPAR